MAFDGGHDHTTARHFEPRALRFALIFPALLALGLIAGGLLISGGLPHGIVLPWGGESVPLAVFLAVGAGGVLLFGAGAGSLGAWIAWPRTLRRISLGVAMTLQLSIVTLFAAALLGQGGSGGLPPERVDGYVLLMGTGLAVAMGVVLGMTFKPEEAWSAGDDTALQAMIDAESDPGAAADRLQFLVHPRSSIVIMILLAALLPGALLALLSPWILLGLAVAALVLVASLCAVVSVTRRGLTVKILGFIPVLAATCEGLDGAISLHIVARDYGGVGLRRRGGRESYLSGSGAAVVLRQSHGGTVVVSAPTLNAADALAEILNRRAGKLPTDK